jgi:hypothetical protein
MYHFLHGEYPSRKYGTRSETLSRSITTHPDLARERQMVLDDFDVLGMVGKGAFATVHLVRLKKTGQTYAMKAIEK